MPRLFSAHYAEIMDLFFAPTQSQGENLFGLVEGMVYSGKTKRPPDGDLLTFVGCARSLVRTRLYPDFPVIKGKNREFFQFNALILSRPYPESPQTRGLPVQNIESPKSITGNNQGFQLKRAKIGQSYGVSLLR